ncbi:cathepsin L1-like [Drosophila takahashii]|uniref:cathepsin L1-like n=2 Tax=Drosophila takahashii TaxID=29030 RepID=UPI00389940D4
MRHTLIFLFLNLLAVVQPRKTPDEEHQMSCFDLPKKWDWRSQKAVSPVRDQGSCYSCWAFATAAAIESHYFIKTKKRILLSPQHLIDCTLNNNGCNNGTVTNAMNYITENDGIATEQSYPYEGIQGKCRNKDGKIGATISGFTRIPEGDEMSLADAVAFKGPVVAVIDSDHYSLSKYSYNTGIYYEPKCSPNFKGKAHSILVVGFGTESGQDYWLAKSSWGVGWGIDGYIKISRNNENHCGIASYAKYPVL